MASAIKALRPEVKVFGVEPETAAPAALSFEKGSPQVFPNWKASFVDGAGGQSMFPRMWERMKPIVDGVVMAVVVGVAVLLRRGWKVAAIHVAPLAAIYVVYALIVHVETSSPFGRPPLSATLRWVRSGEVGTFLGLGHFTVVATTMAVLLVVGLVFVGFSDRGRALRARASVPIALLVGGPVFAAVTAQGRWWFGDQGARASRYVYIGAAMTLPALAVAADALARRWRGLTPALVALFLVAIPANTGGFEIYPFGRGFHENNERLITAAPRMPFARDVPRDVRPVPRISYSDVTIGFLLDARAAGKLPDGPGPIGPQLVNEMRVRLGVAQRYAVPRSETCREVRSPLDVSPKKGSTYGFTGSLSVATRSGQTTTSPPVAFSPAYGQTLTIELDGLDLRFEAPRGTESFTLCPPPETPAAGSACNEQLQRTEVSGGTVRAFAHEGVRWKRRFASSRS